MRGFLLCSLLVIMWPLSFAAQQPQFKTYDDVVRGMTCKQNSVGDMECEYRVGRSLHFIIAGVGEEDAGISFHSSSFEGDYYASFGILHGCVIVKPGKTQNRIFDMAFVSPRTGKVFRDWESCGAAKQN